MKFVTVGFILILACMPMCLGDSCQKSKAFKVFMTGERELNFLNELQINSSQLQVTIQRPAKRINSSFIFTVPDCQHQNVLTLLRKHEIVNYEVFDPTFKPDANLRRHAYQFNPEIVTRQYLSHEESDDYIENIATLIQKLNPKISAQVKVEAFTFERRQMKSITIQYRGKSNPVIIIDAGMHAREWHSRSMALYLLKQLCDEAILDKRGLIYRASFVIVPGVNPDGYEFSRMGDKMWRKNRQPVPSRNCFGVDPNRNFDVHWSESVREHRPCDEVYGGPMPFSEPETQGIKNIMERWKEQTRMYISIHTYGNTIIYPYGYTKKPHPNRILLHQIAMAGVNAIYAETKSYFKADQSGSSLYVAPGGSDDYAIENVGVPFSYTFELGPEEFGFAVPQEQIQKTVIDGFIGIKAMILESLKF